MVDILASDYNTLQQRVANLLGTGTATFGYGQTVQSSAVFQGNTILASQWDNLANDIKSVYIHQTGNSPSIRNVDAGDLIDDTSADPKVNYANLLTNLESNKFDLAPSQSLITAIDTKTYSSSWSSLVSMTVTATFSTALEARFFFNSGGRLRLAGVKSGGSASAQNTSWSNLLSSVGARDFGADTNPNLNFYNLTNNFQTYYEESSSSPYASNRVLLEAKCNVANNATGTATEVELKLSYIDDYTDPGPPAPGDLVDGTITIDLTEIKASGNLQPSGSFTITSPSFTVSSISGT